MPSVRKKTSEHSRRLNLAAQQRRQKRLEIIMQKDSINLTLNDFQQSSYMSYTAEELKNVKIEKMYLSEQSLYLYALLSNENIPRKVKTGTSITGVSIQHYLSDNLPYFSPALLPVVAEYLNMLDMSYFFIHTVMQSEHTLKEKKAICHGLLLNPIFDFTDFYSLIFGVSELTPKLAEEDISFVIEDKKQFIIDLFPNVDRKWELLHEILNTSRKQEDLKDIVIRQVRQHLIPDEDQGLYPDSWVLGFLKAYVRNPQG